MSVEVTIRTTLATGELKSEKTIRTAYIWDIYTKDYLYMTVKV